MAELLGIPECFGLLFYALDFLYFYCCCIARDRRYYSVETSTTAYGFERIQKLKAGRRRLIGLALMLDIQQL
jgi:hypothetical protein